MVINYTGMNRMSSQGECVSLLVGVEVCLMVVQVYLCLCVCVHVYARVYEKEQEIY